MLYIIEVIKYILKFDKLKAKEQRVLTLALISIERLMKKQKIFQQMYEEHSIICVMELLFRCIYQKDNEFQLDQR